MENNEGTKGAQLTPIVILNIGAFLLAAGAVYITKTLATYYGMGIGAAIQSTVDHNSTIAPILQSTVLQLPALHQGLLESYVLLIMALVVFGSAFILMLRRNERWVAAVKKYAMLNAAFTIVYIMLLLIILSDYQSSYFNFLYIYVIYAGIAICLGADGVLEYIVRSTRPARSARSISMDPSKPFSNAVALQDQVFSNMSGSLRIVDKHFNSAALINFHRLIDRALTNFTHIVILTSREMMDTGFTSNLNDFRNELGEMGVQLDVRLLDDKDAVDQHERMMLDDRIAYKIPPFNIINKRSEHITKIGFEESNRRFSYLYGRAIKLENYSIKKGREEPQN